MAKVPVSDELWAPTSSKPSIISPPLSSARASPRDDSVRCSWLRPGPRSCSHPGDWSPVGRGSFRAFRIDDHGLLAAILPAETPSGPGVVTRTPWASVRPEPTVPGPPLVVAVSGPGVSARPSWQSPAAIGLPSSVPGAILGLPPAALSNVFGPASAAPSGALEPLPPAAHSAFPRRQRASALLGRSGLRLPRWERRGGASVGGAPAPAPLNARGPPRGL